MTDLDKQNMERLRQLDPELAALATKQAEVFGEVDGVLYIPGRRLRQQERAEQMQAPFVRGY